MSWFLFRCHSLSVWARKSSLMSEYSLDLLISFKGVFFFFPLLIWKHFWKKIKTRLHTWSGKRHMPHHRAWPDFPSPRVLLAFVGAALNLSLSFYTFLALEIVWQSVSEIIFLQLLKSLIEFQFQYSWPLTH